MNFTLGFILAIAGLVAASIHLDQAASNYWDFVAFAVVFCGTIAVLIITRPKMKFKTLSQNFMTYLFGIEKNKLVFVKRCFTSITQKSLPNMDSTKIEDKIVADGYEMIELGFSKEKIEDILTDRYLAYKKTIVSISSWIKRCAKYPPAFGLGGTVLGLIHLMNGISAGSDSKETGVRMAVALVATFYGILLSNLVLNPVSEAILEKLKSDEELVEIAIRTVIMHKDEYNLIECQETLNSYLGDEVEKINFANAPGVNEEAALAA